MKKLILTVSIIMVLLTGTLSFATNEHSTEPDMSVAVTSVEDEAPVNGASQKILNNMSKKERKIAEYTDKYNDKTNAVVAYYLDLIQLYSIPVCVIGLTIGAFNFYIVGDKKLDKKEQGFGYIMSFLCGLVFFQVLPFIFALLVAGK